MSEETPKKAKKKQKRYTPEDYVVRMVKDKKLYAHQALPLIKYFEFCGIGEDATSQEYIDCIKKYKGEK